MKKSDCVRQSFRQIVSPAFFFRRSMQFFQIPVNVDYSLDFFNHSQKNGECKFGDKCIFYHDVAEYLANKPADIGERCYLYDTFGKCEYGLACRFAKAHTTAEFKTMEKAELVEAYGGKTLVKNSLSKDLQYRLRKRSVIFKKSEEYLKTLSNNKDQKEQQGNGKIQNCFC